MSDETPQRTALIIGVTGQDGAYLSRLLLEKGYRVAGTSRDADSANVANLERLGVLDDIRLISASLRDFQSVHHALNLIRPDEIYHLAGQSSVNLSFQQPEEALASVALGTLHILEGMRELGPRARLFHAASSECFGDTGGVAVDESAPFRPKSPYAIAKSAAFWEVAAYREAYDLFACSGLCFNHESPLRPVHFVTRKVTRGALRIAANPGEKLRLGDLSIRRDWGWAPEYVEAMWLMLQQKAPEDVVIATGETNSLEAFVAAAFECVGLDWRDHVETDPEFYRPAEIGWSGANPEKAQRALGWQAKTRMREVATRMVEAERRLAEGGDL